MRPFEKRIRAPKAQPRGTLLRRVCCLATGATADNDPPKYRTHCVTDGVFAWYVLVAAGSAPRQKRHATAPEHAA